MSKLNLITCIGAVVCFVCLLIVCLETLGPKEQMDEQMKEQSEYELTKYRYVSEIISNLGYSSEDMVTACKVVGGAGWQLR